MGSRRDGAAFEAVVLPHLDAAHNLARWLTRDPTAAEDVVQTAMLRALTYFAGFQGDNPRAWLLQIVRNTAYSWLAGQRTASHEPLPSDDDPDRPHAELADPHPDPEAQVAAREALGRLDQVLEAMPVELRECVVLREVEAFSYGEIARIANVPIGTVMSRLWRARQLILRQMEHG